MGEELEVEVEGVEDDVEVLGMEVEVWDEEGSIF